MVDMNLEVHILPVFDAERSKQFYQRLGWRLDDAAAPADGVRVVQFTPPGSGCSVNFGQGITAAAPGSFQGALVVSDIVEAHKDLADRGVQVGEVFHGAPFASRGHPAGLRDALAALPDDPCGETADYGAG